MSILFYPYHTSERIPSAPPPPPPPTASKHTGQPENTNMFAKMKSKKLKKAVDSEQNKSLPAGASVNLNNELKAKLSSGGAKNETSEDRATRIERKIEERKNKNSKENTTETSGSQNI